MGMYAPDPPDNSALVEANKEIAEESLQFQREQADIANERATELMEIVRTEVERSQGFADERAEQARDEQARYEDIYAPLQERQADEASDYLTRERLDRANRQQSAIDAQTGRTTADARIASDAARDRVNQSKDFTPVNEALAGEALAATDPRLARDAAARQGVIDRRYDDIAGLGRDEAEFSSYLRDRYKDEYVPIEQRLNAEAMEYDTGARRDAMAGRAISDVGQAFSAEREAAQRRLEGYGVDPSMLRSGALDLQFQMGGATAKAQAGTDARQRVEDVGYARMSDAAARGGALPGASTGSAGAAAGFTGAAAAGAAQPTQQQINADRAFGKLGSAAGVGGALYESGMSGAQVGAGLGQIAVANNSLRNRAEQEKDVQRSLISDVVNTGRGFASAVGGSYGQAIDSGRAAAGTATSGVGTATSVSQAAGSLYSNPINANQSASNMMYDRSAAQQASWQNSFGGFLSSAIPTVAGAAAGGYMGTFSEGGKIPDDASPSRGAIVDDVPGEVGTSGGRVMLDGGEVVVPRDVAEWKGLEYFEKLKQQTRKARAAIPEA